MGTNAILRMCCPDHSGIVAEVSNFVWRNRGNILHLDQHVDAQANVFFMRLEWELDGFLVPRESIESAVADLVRPYQTTQCTLDYTDIRPRLALFVSKENHCLHDLLARYQSGELDVEIPFVVGNHETLRTQVEQAGTSFHHLPITKATKAEQEERQLDLIREHDVDTVILARYMQILSDDLVAELPNQIINIHHSFLPAFVGAKPYHQAWQRGVKIIGATSHYVTAELDEGPIIAQDVIPVSHRQSVKDFIRHGRDLEKIVLARAVWAHVQRRVIAYHNKTVVFG